MENENINSLVSRVVKTFRRVPHNEIVQAVWLAWLVADGDEERAYRFACKTFRKKSDEVKLIFRDVETLDVVAPPVDDVPNDAVALTVAAVAERLTDFDKAIFHNRFIMKKKLRQVAAMLNCVPSTVHRHSKKVAEIFIKEYAKHDNRRR